MSEVGKQIIQGLREALSDRCMTCDNNGKPICSSCIMTGHGNDIDFYRVATDAGKSKGEATT